MNDTQKRVLVVFDEAVTSQAIVSILQNEGYDAKAINSQSRILEITHQFAPDIILINVTFDTTDGYFLCRAIKEKNHERNIRVILIEQEKDEDYLVDPAYGPDDFLMTPFSLDELLSKVEANIALNAD